MQPLVSISCITYNHAPYIQDAIESFLMQKTSFPFEILIHDDASTDGTAQIIQEYQARYPDLIFPYYQKENQFSRGIRAIGARFNIPRARGKYIAMCEGDDYWTDPLKLQKQVDFLEAHPDYVMCFHNTLFTYDDGRPPHLMHEIPWDTCSIVEMILSFNDFAFPGKVTAGHTSSMVFRRGLLNDYPSWVSESFSIDIPVQILLAQYGKAKFIDEAMSVYRKHAGGVSSAPEHEGLKLYENRIMTYEGLKRTLDKKYAAALDQVLSRYYAYVGDLYCNQLKLLKAYGYYRRTAGRGTALGMLSRYVSGHFSSLDLIKRLLDMARTIYHPIRHFLKEVREKFFTSKSDDRLHL